MLETEDAELGVFQFLDKDEAGFSKAAAHLRLNCRILPLDVNPPSSS
jgi:hypothetical protein